MSKTKGSNAERQLIHMFWKEGWAAIRVAGSGSSHYPSPDVLVGNRLRKIAIECKASKEKAKYLTHDELHGLKEFASRFGAEPWVAVKFDRKEWIFLTIEDLKETEQSFVVTEEIMKNKGLLFEELIS
jgi:Holliday junction resolvase